MSLNKIQIRSEIFKVEDKIFRVYGMDTMGEVVQRMSELICGSGRGGKTVLYDISDCLDIFLRLWCLWAKEDTFSVVGSLNGFYCLSERILLGYEGSNVFFSNLCYRCTV